MINTIRNMPSLDYDTLIVISLSSHRMKDPVGILMGIEA